MSLLEDAVLKVAKANPKFRRALQAGLKEAVRTQESVTMEVEAVLVMPVNMDVRDGRVGAISMPNFQEVTSLLRTGEARIGILTRPELDKIQKAYDRSRR